MKKILTLVVLLLIVFTFTAGTIVVAVDATKDQVNFNENILVGEKKDALGVTVNLKSHSSNKLFWDSVYTIADEPTVETDFTFYRQQQDSIATANLLGLSGVSDVGSPSWAFSTSEMDVIRSLYEGLWEKAKPGEEVGYNFYLADIFDYYPIVFEVNLPNYNFSYWDYIHLSEKDRYIVDKFKEYFRIPVLPDERRHISFHKSTNATPEGYGYGPYNDGIGSTKYYGFQTKSTYTEDICYFTINNRKLGVDETVLVDTSLIPGGYGIYAVPYDDGGLDIDRLSTVYSLDEMTVVNQMGICDGDTKLWILTEEYGNRYLRILDIETMTLLQTLNFDEAAISAVYFHEGLLVVNVNEEYRLFLQDENGQYWYEFSFTNYYDNFDYTKSTRYYQDDSWNKAQMIFKNGKLLIVDILCAEKRSEFYYWNEGDDDHYSWSSTAYDVCGFYISIYDKNGVVYHAEYESSLANTLEFFGEDVCSPISVTASWE